MSIFSDFNRLHTELAEAVIACRADHDKHAVHSLRTGMRKLEAVLRKALEDHPGSNRLHKTAQKASHRLKRIRKAAGPVRDFDVHRELALELRGQSSRAGKTSRDGSRANEHKELDRDLKRRRKRAAAKLDKVLKKNEVRLEAELENVARAVQLLSAASPSPLTTARGWALASSPPDVDATDDSFGKKLHEYRKQTKAARYIAGLQETSGPARRLAKSLKDMQDSIGRWHDLMLLTGEAAKALGKRSMLARTARQERDHALDKAARNLRLRHDSVLRV